MDGNGSVTKMAKRMYDYVVYKWDGSKVDKRHGIMKLGQALISGFSLLLSFFNDYQYEYEYEYENDYYKFK